MRSAPNEPVTKKCKLPWCTKLHIIGSNENELCNYHEDMVQTVVWCMMKTNLLPQAAAHHAAKDQLREKNKAAPKLILP